MRVLRTAGSAVLLVLLLVACLATGSVVARLAAHMRDDAWARISVQRDLLRRRATCTNCDGHPR
jgi:hypothetical protein